ncbi:hypothetical protein ABEV09_07205 [Schinkia azotoformans]|uniref:hypothetical protein n=1 Tax=Schinkia azotoformans TaxID=1454 RepID=UPI002DBA407E|nr:hypothetical protein [Schinkia azotoformans]MEC1717230.1 hypothetical protein [Schinkia azotoformans]
MSNNLVVLSEVRKTGQTDDKFIELNGPEKLVNEVNNRWKVSVLKGKLKVEGVTKTRYAIRLTSTLEDEENVESMTFKKDDFEDNLQAKRIIKKLSKIGHVKPNYLKFITNNVNDALYDQKDKIIQVENIESVWLEDINKKDEEVGFEEKLQVLINHIKYNSELFPKHSSGKYEHDTSHGAILDNKKVNSFGYHPIAIRTGVVRELFEIPSTNKYHILLEKFLKMGVLEGKLTFKDIEKDEEVTIDAYGNIKVKPAQVKKVANSLDKQRTLKPKGSMVTVFIFNLDLGKGV